MSSANALNLVPSKKLSFSKDLSIFENIVGKGENAGNQHFLPFCHNIFTLSKTEVIIQATSILSSTNA